LIKADLVDHNDNDTNAKQSLDYTGVVM